MPSIIREKFYVFYHIHSPPHFSTEITTTPETMAHTFNAYNSRNKLLPVNTERLFQNSLVHLFPTQYRSLPLLLCYILFINYLTNLGRETLNSLIEPLQNIRRITCCHLVVLCPCTFVQLKVFLARLVLAAWAWLQPAFLPSLSLIFPFFWENPFFTAHGFGAYRAGAKRERSK